MRPNKVGLLAQPSPVRELEVLNGTWPRFAGSKAGFRARVGGFEHGLLSQTVFVGTCVKEQDNLHEKWWV